MFSKDNIDYIELKLFDTQIDLILNALQLYAFNFHRVWPVERNCDIEEYRNSIIFHTYEQIQAVYNSYGYSHKDYSVLYNCRLTSRNNKIRKYKQAKNIA